MIVGRAVAPPDTRRGLRRGASRVAQAYLHSLGITAWQDAIVGIDSSYRTLDAYAAGGRTTASSPPASSGALWWDRHRGLEQIERLVDARARAAVGRFAATSVKIMQDGVMRELHGRHARRPTSTREGRPTENRGLSFVDPELLKQAVTQLDALGFQVHFHALGDRAVREALDAIEAALIANGPSDDRHHLAHIQVVHPDDIPRFRQLGAVANAQPLWAAHEGQMDDLTIPFLGPSRASLAVPVRQPRARRRDPRDGERLERLEPRPAAGDARRRRTGVRPPRGSRGSARPSARCSSPRSGSTWPPRSGRSPWGPPT